jgi:hypothetical protein
MIMIAHQKMDMDYVVHEFYVVSFCCEFQLLILYGKIQISNLILCDNMFVVTDKRLTEPTVTTE